MPAVKILGKVEPPWFSLDFDFKPQINYRIEQADINLNCTVEINKSQIVVECDLNRWSDDVMPWIMNYVFDFVSAQIDLFTFASGKVFHVHLDRAQYPDGSQRMLIAEAPYLATLATACKLSDDSGRIHVEMKQVFPIIVTNPTLMLAFRDLCSALKFGNNTLANCGRAIEGMRKSLWGKDEADRKQELKSWEHFRSTLRLSTEYLRSITDASKQPRHGSSAYVGGQLRQDVLGKSWTVMNRLLLFHLGGKQPMSETEYPVL